MPRPRLTIADLMLLDRRFRARRSGPRRLRRRPPPTAASAEYSQMANLLTEEGRTLEDVADAGGGAWLARWKGKTDEDWRDYRTEMPARRRPAAGEGPALRTAAGQVRQAGPLPVALRRAGSAAPE